MVSFWFTQTKERCSFAHDASDYPKASGCVEASQPCSVPVPVEATEIWIQCRWMLHTSQDIYVQISYSLMHLFLPFLIFQIFSSSVWDWIFWEKKTALSFLITSILAKCRNWVFKASFQGGCWIFRTRARNNLSKPYVFINMFCFWLSVFVFSVAHQHFIVLSNPSTAQDRWSAGLVQILHLTPIQSHSKIIHGSREKENLSCSYHYICILKSVPYVYPLKNSILPHRGNTWAHQGNSSTFITMSAVFCHCESAKPELFQQEVNAPWASIPGANKDAGTGQARD